MGPECENVGFGIENGDKMCYTNVGVDINHFAEIDMDVYYLRNC